MKKLSEGFTLIELMIVVAVIAILATLAFYGLSGAQKGARDTQRVSLINNIRTAMERYASDKGAYPSGNNFSAVVSQLSNANYFTNTAADPGCGSGTQAFNAGTYSSNNFYPCGTGGQVYYSQTGTGPYSLILSKEGGAVITVKSAQ